MISKQDFITLIDERVVKILSKRKGQVQFAKIPADYVSGKPSLLFDGETVATTKKYQVNADITLSPNDHVLVLNDVVICKIVR